MKENNIFLEEIINDLKHHFNDVSNYELINELKRICKKKDEEVTYHDIEVVLVILGILKERGEL